MRCLASARWLSLLARSQTWSCTALQSTVTSLVLPVSGPTREGTSIAQH
jgi:hypothetical protein